MRFLCRGQTDKAKQHSLRSLEGGGGGGVFGQSSGAGVLVCWGLYGVVSL